ncbi:MAG: NAD-dependent protein deacylase [Planctomycetaceae bacterium]|nr:NAD-dependent protein deacylase [Planctomycetaceae bacterium]
MPETSALRIPPDGRIVVLTGAGISAESGVPTFRGADGLWEGHRVEDVATPEAFARQPELVQRFYNERRRKLLAGDIQPNAAHAALAELDANWPGEFLLVTQNIDDLHERAGSRRLLHMHGELLKARCSDCGAVHRWQDDLTAEAVCSGCQAGGRLRPHVVWFGEVPIGLEESFAALASADLFLAIGTSGNVYPAAGFVDVVRQAGRGRAIEMNLEATVAAGWFDEQRIGPATQTVPALVAELLAEI